MLHLGRIRSIGEALRDAMVPYKSNVALIEANRHRENRRWTYAELREDAEAFAARLQARGFQAGDRCAIVMQNQARWLISATGAFWAGATLVPLDYKLTAGEQFELIRHASPKVVVTEYSTWRKLHAVAEQAEAMDVFERTMVLVTDAPADTDLQGALEWDRDHGGTFELVQRERSDLACIVYSSGTGGRPKGCMLSHGNYLAQAESLGRLFPAREDDRYFSILPTNHAIDFMVGYLLPLMFGAAIVHQRTLRPQFLGPTMKRYGVTQMAVVPTILKALERRIRERLDELPEWQQRVLDGLISVNDAITRREPNHRLSSLLLKPIHDELGGELRRVFAGGAFIDPSTANFFYRLGIPVVIGYGLTEAGTVVSVNDLSPFRADTVGKPVPGVEVEVRNPTPSGVGEIWVRGPTVMQGYLDEPELTAETIVEGWLKTGDVGFFDASGHLRLLGRVKNMIVTEGGKNIYPEDIEAAFEDVGECEEFCVFAANYLWPSTNMTGEQLVLVLRPEEGRPEPMESLLEELRRRNRALPDFKRIAGYVSHTREFPRTASLKIKREQLAEDLRGLDRDRVFREL